jgi:hypothetical protein
MSGRHPWLEEAWRRSDSGYPDKITVNKTGAGFARACFVLTLTYITSS